MTHHYETEAKELIQVAIEHCGLAQQLKAGSGE
jgi:hypothetical protein